MPECSTLPSAQAPEVNAVVVPVGGGGMIAGIAVAIKVGSSPGGEVVAASSRGLGSSFSP